MTGSFGGQDIPTRVDEFYGLHILDLRGKFIDREGYGRSEGGTGYIGRYGRGI